MKSVVPCNARGCSVSDILEEMTPVVVLVDGAPLVGQGCTLAHAVEWAAQVGSGDRYSEPVDPIWATVGNGQVAA